VVGGGSEEAAVSEGICGHGAGDGVGSGEVAGSDAMRGEGRGGGRFGRGGEASGGPGVERRELGLK
jgi:hypothetical protein